MTPAWRRRGGWIRLAAWEKEFGVFAAVTSRVLGNMKDPSVFRRRLADAGLDPARWAGGEQVHGVRVVSVARPRGREKARTDGVSTRAAEVTLRVFTADCVPVFLLDPVRRVIGLVHAGWRGADRGIVPKAVRHLARRYGCRPEDLRVAFGPHIRECCFEIGPEVARRFEGTSGAVPPGRRTAGGRPLLNLSAVIRAQARRAGVRPSRVIGPPGCTSCDSRFFSYRRDGTDRRQAALLCLRVHTKNG